MISKQNVYIQETEVDGETERLMITAYEPIDAPGGEYAGHAMIGIQTPQGTLEQPIMFPIEADSIQEAFGKFKEARETEAPKEARRIITEMQNQMRQQQEEERNRIVVPGMQ